MPPMLAIHIQLQHLEKQDKIIEPYHKNNIWHCKEQSHFEILTCENWLNAVKKNGECKQNC